MRLNMWLIHLLSRAQHSWAKHATNEQFFFQGIPSSFIPCQTKPAVSSDTWTGTLREWARRALEKYTKKQMIMADVNVEEPTCHSPRGRRKELKWQMSDSKVLKMRSAIMRKEHLSKNYYRNKRRQREKLRKLANKVDCCHEIAPKLSNLDL